ncbi:hypothetical protein MKW98_000588 [Papaver atlanticum]|uniref:Uncharacterized protein n=1 Tax=Papaver atlanticum TaxID=357466 RepID=A0AAD4S4S8_9MAGN|nr:hypothetical protein MKW98_000588 [Papaver atlanticum]
MTFGEEKRKRKTMERKERTFVLCYPNLVVFRDVGEILMEFEKISLNVVETFSPIFAPAGFCSYPFVAMILEGDDAISKVHQLTSETERFPFRSSVLTAVRSNKKQSSGVRTPDGKTFGPVDAVVDKLREQDLLWCRYFEKEALFRSFYNNFYHENLTFFLIRPLAFQKRCVGLLLSIIENIDFGIMGMDLVTKSEVPTSDAWPADSCSSPGIDGYGIALLVECINHKAIPINTSCRDARILIDKDDGTVEICSDLVYMGKPGDRSMIGHYFKFGTVSWLDSSSGASCGGFFLATLSSLQF